MAKPFIREYKLEKIIKDRLFPERCDFCKKYQYKIYKFIPLVRTHTYDNLFLCEACLKKVFDLNDDEITQMAKRSSK